MGRDADLVLSAGHYGSKAKVFTRYATKKEPGIFNQSKLEQAAASLPESFTLSTIDEKLYKLCKSETWSADLVSQFPTYDMFQKLGIGVVIRKDGLILSGASSYSRYRDDIEIEIDTREEYRRKGLAYICGAKLILECLKRNLYPSWDAHNPASIALAEKLGYHFSHTYEAAMVWGGVSEFRPDAMQNHWTADEFKKFLEKISDNPQARAGFLIPVSS